MAGFHELPWRRIESANPFFVERLPLICRLYLMGFHRFKRRIAKRLLKRPARWLFDFAYHVLKLGGAGVLDFRHGGETKHLRFNARSLHFATVYSYDREQIFEPQVMGLLEALVRDDEVFFDIGANWGMETLHAAALDGWSGAIHAFEPIPATFTDLHSLVEQAGLEDRVHCHNLALSNATGDAAMRFSDGFSSGTAALAEPAALSETGGGITVTTACLDDLGLPDPTFMKLDVEGHEARTLAGGTEMIRRCRPFIIFETWFSEQNFKDSEDVFRMLGDLGYVFFRPAWGLATSEGVSVWPHTQPPSPRDRLLTLVPMDPRVRPFMAGHIDVFACHGERLDDLMARFAPSSID